MSDTAVCTVIAKNYLSFARVLAGSLRQHHPELPLFVAVVDEPDGCFDPDGEAFRPLDLGLSAQRRFAFPRQRLVVSAKVLALRALLDRGYSTALFLDADMLVLDGLDPLLESSGDVVLTPHLLQPADTRRELTILVSGVFNGGVARVSSTPAGRDFLDDWGDRLETHCRWDPARGLHWDQRWLDLAAARHGCVEILRDPGINAAYWAMPERRGAHLRLFHFSGFEPWHSERATKYSATAERGPLFDRYAALLWHAGVERTIRFPYSWDRFENGVPIPALARELYDGRRGDPFATGPGSFFAWLRSPVDDGEPAVAQVWHGLWAARPDLQQGFPDHQGEDRAAFAEWTRRPEPDHDVHPIFAG